MKNYIYLDNGATVKAFDSVLELAIKTEKEYWYNSGAMYSYALGLNQLIENTREIVAETIGCQASELFFTGGATEANNWAIAKGIKSKKGTIITTQTEHDSIQTTLANLNSEHKVITLGFDKDGRVDLEELARVVTSDTVFVSLIHVCGQTGIQTDIAKAVKIIRAKAPDCVIHSDGVQSYMRVDVNVKDMDVDMYTMSGHKIGGLKGVGLLYVKKGFNLNSFHVGGNQENQKRGGTRNNGAIVSMYQAVKEYQKIPRQFFWDLKNTLVDIIKGEHVLIIPSDIAQIFTVCFANQKAQVLQNKLFEEGVLIGTGAACSLHDHQNRIIKNRGIKAPFIDGTMRISVGPHNTIEEMKKAGEIINRVVKG